MPAALEKFLELQDRRRSSSSRAGSRTRPTADRRDGKVRAAPQAAGQAAALGARGGPRVPGDHGAAQDRLPGGEAARAVRGRVGDRHRVLRHGLRRGPRALGPVAAGHDARPSARRSGTSRTASSRCCTRSTIAAVGLEDFGKPGNYIGRQVERWSKQYRASETQKHRGDGQPHRLAAEEHPARGRDHRGARRLPPRQHHLPSDRAAHPRGARLGALHARRSARRLRLPLHELAHPAGQVPRHGRAADLQELGIPSRSGVREALLRANRRKAASIPSYWDFYLAYNLFRIAAICQGIAKRVLDGTAASQHAQEAASKTVPLAELGWQQVEKILRRAA